MNLEERTRRTRRKMRRVISVIFLVVIALTILETYLREVRAPSPLSTNLLFFTLFNINVLLLMILVLLVLRNWIELYFERRSQVLGARFKAKLMLAFVGFSLIPSVLLFLVASGLLTHSIDKWFNVQVENSLKAAQEVVEIHYQSLSKNAVFFAEQVGEHAPLKKALSEGNKASVTRILQAFRENYSLDAIQLFDQDQKLIAWTVNPEIKENILVRNPYRYIRRSLAGRSNARIKPVQEGVAVRGFVPVWGGGSSGAGTLQGQGPRDGGRPLGAITVTYYIPSDLAARIDQITDTFEDYLELKPLKNPVKTNYFITFLMITLLIIFSATWFGFHLARGITIPIQKLAEGTRAIAAGNLDFKIEARAQDEIGILVDSFNQMTEELKESKTQLIKTQRVAAWQEVARGLAHEIKNPLTPIQLSAQRLKKKYRERAPDLDAVFDDCIDTIIAQVDGLRGLVDEFSRFARLPEADPQPQDFHGLIDEVVLLYEASHRGVEIQREYDKAVGRVKVDGEQLKRALINLVENAIEAMEGQGRIWIRTGLSRDAKFVRLEVSDEGEGVPIEDRDKLFLPHFSTKKRGTGLGLAIVSRIVEEHGGSIAARDHHPRGSTFTMLLPV